MQLQRYKLSIDLKLKALWTELVAVWTVKWFFVGRCSSRPDAFWGGCTRTTRAWWRR